MDNHLHLNRKKSGKLCRLQIYTYLIFVTCTTCSAGVKISRLVSKNSSNYGYFTYHHHSGGGRVVVVAPPPPLQHHHHHTLPPPPPLYHHRHHQIQLCCDLRCFVAKLFFSRDLRVFGVKFLSWKWCWCQKHRKNCECCHHHSLFKGNNVIVHIDVHNCQKCNQCLKCQVSGHKCLGLIFESVL